MNHKIKSAIIIILGLSVFLIVLYLLYPKIEGWNNNRKPNYTPELAIFCWNKNNPDILEDFYINPDNKMSEDIIDRYNKSVDILNSCRDTFKKESLINLQDNIISYEELIQLTDPRYKNNIK